MKRSLRFIDLTLRSPYIFEGQLRSSKKSAILEFTTPQGIFSSECSIFPGLHQEDLKLLEKQFLALPDLPNPNEAYESLEQICLELSFLESQPANLRFAYEAVCFHYWLVIKKLPMSLEILKEKDPYQSSINSLITNPHDYDWDYFDKSSKCVKLKLGRSQNVEQDIALLSKLRENFPQTIWRIDANEAYELDDLKKWEEHLCEKIEYFENPCKSPTSWPKKSSLPLALESSPLTHPSWWSAQIPLKAIVHKPSLSWGFFQTLLQMKNSKVPLILSSTFEGPLGLRDLLILKELSGSTQTHGLGTWREICGAEQACQIKQTVNELIWMPSYHT